MIYTEPAVLATYKATSAIQMTTGDKIVGLPDAPATHTTNPAYEGDE